VFHAVPPIVITSRTGRAIVWFVFALALAGCTRNQAPEAMNGVLDLRSFSGEQIVSVEGQWLARADDGRGVVPDFDRDNASWRVVDLPSSFVDQGFDNEGVVWYRLRLLLPANAPALEGYLQDAHMAHAVYAAQPGHMPVLIARSGRPDRPEALTTHRLPVQFALPSARELILTWKVVNRGYVAGGPVHPILIGTPTAIRNRLTIRTAATFTLFGLYLFLGLLLLFWRVNARGDRRLLALLVVAVLMSAYTLVGSGFLETFRPNIFDVSLHHTLITILPLLLIGMMSVILWTFFPGSFTLVSVGRWRSAAPDQVKSTSKFASARKVFFTTSAVFAVGISVTIAFVLVAAPAPLISLVMKLTWVFALLLTVPALLFPAHILQRRERHAVAFSIGLAIILAGGLHDLLVATQLLPGRPSLLGAAVFIFLVIATHAVAQDYNIAGRLVAPLAGLSGRDRQRLRATTIAMQASRMVESRFLADVGHELRSPLASILGYSQMLEDELRDRLEAHHREFFQTIRVSAERLLALINDILDLARLEADQIEFQLASVRVPALVADICTQFEPIADRQEVELVRDVADDVPAVRADAMRLRQVLVNLLENAFQFTSKGKITIHVSSTTLEGRPAVSIDVEDTGTGIAPDFLPRIFERFTQEERLFDKKQGSGLGLTISRKLITQMGGSLSVESEPGEGATFTIRLPAVHQPPAADALLVRKRDRDPKRNS